MESPRKYLERLINDKRKIDSVSTGAGRTIEIEIRFDGLCMDPDRVQSLFDSIDTSSETANTDIIIGTSNANFRKRFSVEKNVYEIKESISYARFSEIRAAIHSSIETVQKVDKRPQVGVIRKKVRRSKDHKEGFRLDVTRIEDSWEVEIEITSSDVEAEKLYQYIQQVFALVIVEGLMKEAPDPELLAPLTFDNGKVKGFTKPKEAYIQNFMRGQDGIFSSGSIYVTGKLDGLRCVLIIRNGNVYRCSDTEPAINVGKVRAPDCIMDAELYEDSYFPFDLISIRKENMAAMSFRERVRRLRWLTGKCGFEWKEQYFAKNFKDLRSSIAVITSRPYRLDGIIMTSASAKYDEQPFKWKRVPTVDVTVRGDEAFFRCRNRLTKVPKYTVKPSQIKESVYECTIDVTTYTLRVIKERTDKVQPNSSAVVMSMIRAFEKGSILSEKGLEGNNEELFSEFLKMLKREILSKRSGILVDIGYVNCKKGQFDRVISVSPQDLKTYIAPRIDIVSSFFSLADVGVDGMVKFLSRLKSKRGTIEVVLVFLDLTKFKQNIDSKFVTLRLDGKDFVYTVHGTRAMNIRENAISATDLIRKVAKFGYRPADYGTFSGDDSLTEDQKEFARLFSFVSLIRRS